MQNAGAAGVLQATRTTGGKNLPYLGLKQCGRQAGRGIGWADP